MDIIFLTNSVSPHQVPLCTEIAKRLGNGSMTYVYTEPMSKERQKLGWCESYVGTGLKILPFDKGQDCGIVENCQLLIADIRDALLFEKRAQKKHSTLYMSERWFKPPFGFLRLLHPKFFMMALKVTRMLKYSPGFIYLPQGIHAARDMARLCGLLHGDLRCLFRAPELDFERKPGGKIWLKKGSDGKRYCLDKMRIWGYFVESSKFTVKREELKNELRVLWVGRFLGWKCVDAIVRAVGEHANLKCVDNSLPKITLDIYGTGTEESRLKKMASRYDDCINFYPPVPIAEVRRLMREHDMYVLASNAYEGWGAVVSEALEEGMKVVGTYEAGSSATILPRECLFHAGDCAALMKLLQNANALPLADNVTWSAKNAAEAMIDILEDEA